MQGGLSWTGIIADTNSCNVDNWWYRLAEEERPEGYDFFAQPPALLVEKDAEGKLQYRENPEAENIENHTAGTAITSSSFPASIRNGSTSTS